MALDSRYQTVSGPSESAVLLVAMATGMGDTLHRSPRNAESFRIKQRAFHLVPPDGGLLVHCRCAQSIIISVPLLLFPKYPEMDPISTVSWPHFGDAQAIAK